MSVYSSCKINLAGAAVFIMLSLVTVQPATSQGNASYTVVDLGALTSVDISAGALINESVSFARSSNRAGNVVGRSGYITGSDTRAVLWTKNGAESLGVLPGGDYSAAFGINDAGDVVGTSNTDTVVRAFRWTRRNGMQELSPLPQDNGSEAFHINNAGQVVGTSSGSQGVRAVLWSRNGSIQSLGTLPGGDYSRAIAINDTGDVVGTSTSAAGTRAFLWTRPGGMQDLGTLPGHTTSEAFNINNAGRVVGYSSGPRGTRAFLWTRPGGMQDLGTLPGGDYSRALGINDGGQVVGTSTSAAGLRAFLWTSRDGMQDLNALIPPLDLGDPGLVLSEAHAINYVGHIVALTGAGEQDPNRHNHRQEHFYRVFFLTLE